MDRLGPPAFPAFLTARRPSVTKQYKTANQYPIYKFPLQEAILFVGANLIKISLLKVAL